jgi:hypothetical protein
MQKFGLSRLEKNGLTGYSYLFFDTNISNIFVGIVQLELIFLNKILHSFFWFGFPERDRIMGFRRILKLNNCFSTTY